MIRLSGLSNVMIYDIIDVLPILSHTHIDFCDLCPKLHQLLYRKLEKFRVKNFHSYGWAKLLTRWLKGERSSAEEFGGGCCIRG